MKISSREASCVWMVRISLVLQNLLEDLVVPQLVHGEIIRIDIYLLPVLHPDRFLAMFQLQVPDVESITGRVPSTIKASRLQSSPASSIWWVVRKMVTPCLL